MLIHNIGRLVSMEPTPDREGRLGVIPRAAVWMAGERIKWLGPEVDLPREAEVLRATALDADGRVVMPGLIDCHTHLVHAGSRVDEFVRRARGATYEEILAAGGGIHSTVTATRAATPDQLFESARGRANTALHHGVTTLEIKSGYGLDTTTELTMLRVVARLRQELPQQFIATFLGAHVCPQEYRDDRDGYVRLLCDDLIPRVAEERLAECVDVFVETGAFTADEARRISAAGAARGLRTRLHVDQFHDGNGGVLAAELRALSADHLEYLNTDGIAAMRRAGVVAGILPGATLCVNARRHPPVAALVEAGVPIAIATDFNPGSSPTQDLMLCGTMAVTQFGLDPDLALLGMTKVAAQALGRAEQLGSLAPGKRADLLVLQATNEYEPLYRCGALGLRYVLCGGEIIE